MKNTITSGFTAALLALSGCSAEAPLPTGADVGPGIPRLALPSSPTLGASSTLDELPQDACPDIYYESTETLSNGATVTWTSSFGGFDYTMEGDYTVNVDWIVDDGTATFESFVAKNNVWTPKDKKNRLGKGVDGTWTFDEATGGLTVNMKKMHRSEEEDWLGYIGNGHFKLELMVNGIKAKLGVNVHLEDPDDRSVSRCTEISP